MEFSARASSPLIMAALQVVVNEALNTEYTFMYIHTHYVCCVCVRERESVCVTDFSSLCQLEEQNLSFIKWSSGVGTCFELSLYTHTEIL